MVNNKTHTKQRTTSPLLPSVLTIVQQTTPTTSTLTTTATTTTTTIIMIDNYDYIIMMDKVAKNN